MERFQMSRAPPRSGLESLGHMSSGAPPGGDTASVLKLGRKVSTYLVNNHNRRYNYLLSLDLSFHNRTISNR
jgi:hypothetical protein